MPTSVRRARIAGGLSERLVSAEAQDQQTRRWKARAIRDAGEPFFAFFLSYQGYVRRGVADRVTSPPETGAGLLVMCYQARRRQLVIQQEGADSDDFVTTGGGPDATLGNNATRLAQQ